MPKNQIERIEESTQRDTIGYAIHDVHVFDIALDVICPREDDYDTPTHGYYQNGEYVQAR